MSTFNHHCPELSPNSKAPNITASSCKKKIATRIGKCTKCPSGVGYVKPRKVITERLWRNPKEKKPAKRVRKPRTIVERRCACGAKVEYCKTLCTDCRETKRKNVIIRARVKKLQRRIDINLKVIDELNGNIGREYKKVN